MTTPRIPIAVIKGGLVDQFDRLVRQLVPDGRVDGSRWMARSPGHPGKSRDSFSALLAGSGRGGWKDFKADAKGDPIDLISHVLGGTKGDAIRWATEWLGLGGTIDGATLARMKREAEERAARVRQDQADKEAEKARRAFRMWLAASAKIADTPVETYLESRGLPLSEIPNIETGELRYAPRLEWWKGAEWEGKRKIAPGPYFPAMVAAIRQPSGEITAVHCTFLAPDGRGKAPVSAPKLMFGPVHGGVIRLSRGPSNLTPEEAAAAGVAGLLAIGEGIEDGLTLAIGGPEARVWSATSLGNLGNVPLGHPCVSAAIVAKDNEWDNPHASVGFAKAIERLAEHGRPIVTIASHAGKDFNDLVRGET